MMSDATMDMQHRILDGEAINILQATKEYFPDEEYEDARRKIAARIGTIRARLAQEGILVCQVADGMIGIPQNKTQVEYGMEFYRNRIERSVAYALMLYAYSKRKNILPDNYRNKTISLPIFGR